MKAKETAESNETFIHLAKQAGETAEETAVQDLEEVLDSNDQTVDDYVDNAAAFEADNLSGETLLQWMDEDDSGRMRQAATERAMALSEGCFTRTLAADTAAQNPEEVLAPAVDEYFGNATAFDAHTASGETLIQRLLEDDSTMAPRAHCSTLVLTVADSVNKISHTLERSCDRRCSSSTRTPARPVSTFRSSSAPFEGRVSV